MISPLYFYPSQKFELHSKQRSRQIAVVLGKNCGCAAKKYHHRFPHPPRFHVGLPTSRLPRPDFPEQGEEEGGVVWVGPDFLQLRLCRVTPRGGLTAGWSFWSRSYFNGSCAKGSMETLHKKRDRCPRFSFFFSCVVGRDGGGWSGFAPAPPPWARR